MFGEETGHVMLMDITSIGPSQETMPLSTLRGIFDESPTPPLDKSDVEEEGEENGSQDTNEAADTRPSPISSGAKTSDVIVYSFVIKSKDGYTRTFRCSREEERERWIEAITMTIAQIQYESEHRANAPSPSNSSPIMERKETIDGIDFAPVGSAFKKPKYLYHSDKGGTCFGGAAPPVPHVITCGTRVIKTDDLGDAAWGETGAFQFTMSKGEVLTIFLTNGGRSEIGYDKMQELASLNSSKEAAPDTKGLDLDGDLVEATGMRYPGCPALVARITVAALHTEQTPSKKESEFDLVERGATYILQPLALFLYSTRMSKGFSLPIDQIFRVCFILNAVPFVVSFLSESCASFIARKRKTEKSFHFVLKSYEESNEYEDDFFLEKPVPARFVSGTKTDPPGTAQSRWATTMAWRKREKVDTIILKPHPYFSEIKECYPHFYCRVDLTGKQVAYYERPGLLDIKRLAEIGVPTLIKHYIFQIEFCWMYMSPAGEDSRTLSAVDVQNVGFYDLQGIAKEFLGAISKVSQDHYPERAGKICILNAPGWFTMLWNVVKLTLHPNTQKKVYILSEGAAKKTMPTLIPHDSVPTEYGGQLKFDNGAPVSSDSYRGGLGAESERARYCSEFEVATADYVRRLNEKKKLPLPCKQAWEREDILLGKEEFLAAYEPGWEDYESQLHLPRDQWDPNGWPGMLFK